MKKVDDSGGRGPVENAGSGILIGGYADLTQNRIGEFHHAQPLGSDEYLPGPIREIAKIHGQLLFADSPERVGHDNRLKTGFGVVGQFCHHVQ